MKLQDYKKFITAAFVNNTRSRYQLYLPNREQLESEFRRFMRSEEDTE